MKKIFVMLMLFSSVAVADVSMCQLSGQPCNIERFLAGEQCVACSSLISTYETKKIIGTSIGLHILLLEMNTESMDIFRMKSERYSRYYTDVRVTIDGATKDFALSEFKSRLGFLDTWVTIRNVPLGPDCTQTCCWIDAPNGGATVVCDKTKITMPTVDVLRLFVRFQMRKARENKNDPMTEVMRRIDDLEWAYKELKALGDTTTYLEERRRSDLIEHGYNPPEKIEGY